MDDVCQKLVQVFRDVFEDDSIQLKPQFTALDVPGWDSLNHVRLVLSVQKAFGIKLSAAQAANLKNVGELAELIRAKMPAA